MDKIFYWVAYALMGALALIARLFHVRLTDVEKDLQGLRVHLPESYVRKVDLQDLRNEIMGALTRIYDKLDEKQDRD